jgi:glycerol-3-phosphate O-acyltransferase
MATEGGVVQAVFLEGRLSRDGKLREPKIGLLDYMLRDFDPERERDIVFIPAGVNYDRVLEDRTVLLDTGPGAGKMVSLRICCSKLRPACFYAGICEDTQY